MAAQQQHNIDTDADVALRAAINAMRWSSRNLAPDEKVLEAVRAMCPALSLPERYSDFQSIDGWCQLDHELAVIKANDVPAVLELIRADPELLTHESPAEDLGPPLVLAVKLGHHEVIEALLKYRATVPPELRGPRKHEDWNVRGFAGTPLTTACASGRLDTLRLLLNGMPDANINEVDNNGRTPFLAAVSEHHGPTDARLALLRFLLENGADMAAVEQMSLAHDEGLDQEFDEDLANDYGPLKFRPRPGGYGNALALAMENPQTDLAILTLLAKAGVNIYQSRWEAVDRVDQTGDKTNDDADGRYEHFYYDRAFLSPMAVGAMHRNVVGVKALLDLFPNDHFRLLATTDVTAVPEPRPPLRDPDDEVPVILPLHAALFGQFIRFMPPKRDETIAAVEVVQLITADEAIRTATINTPYRKHYTPLHLATGFDRIPMLMALVALGADLNVPRHDGQGLILALFSSVSRLSPKQWSGGTEWAVAVDASTDMTAVITTLLERYRPRVQDADIDADNAAARLALVNEADAKGNTPLHFAVAYKLSRSTAALVALGARADATNHAGEVACAPP